MDIALSASVGIAAASVPEGSADDVLRNTDLALYEAKSRRKGQFARYEPAMPRPPGTG